MPWLTERSLRWGVSVCTTAVITTGDDYLAEMVGLLSSGALLTLALAGISLLATVTGQISERRRPLAAMSAAGVPRGVLERSLLWQNAVPMLFGVLVAVVGGIGIARLLMRLMDGPPFALDGPSSRSSRSRGSCS
jgi:ABC-type antimicrobial peptide transport system permease subunit